MALAQPKPAVSDHLVAQDWQGYSAAEHATWKTLFERQQQILQGRACAEFLSGIHALDVTAAGIPDFRRLNEILKASSGWEIAAVAGLVPDDVFFALLADRKFPATCFIRTPAQLDYIQEPDVFHDVFGHVPLLVHPVFGDYMQAYGAGGLKALGLEPQSTVANFMLVKVPEKLGKTPDEILAFCAERGIFMREMKTYGMTGYFRFSIGTEEENQALIDTLAECLGHG